MKLTKELETVEVFGVKFDVHFTYHADYGFEIEAIEDVTGTQDLKELLYPHIITKIEYELMEIYRKRGWL